MNNTKCPVDSSDLSRNFLTYFYSLIFIIGVTANGWGLKSLQQNWKKLGHVNVFILNLGLADFLYLLTLPFWVTFYIMENKWIFGDTFCKITRLCFNFSVYGSIGFLTCISVYRYLAIVHPMKVLGRITATRSVIISIVVWMLVAAQSFPDIFFPKSSENQTCCSSVTDDSVEDYLKYSLGRTLIGLCIPFLITVGCYGHMIVVLCSKNISDEVMKQKCLRLLFVSILLFSVCYIPHHVINNLRLWSRVLCKQEINHKWGESVFEAHQIIGGFACLNSALKPLVYLYMIDDVPAKLKQLLQRVCQNLKPTPVTATQVSTEEMYDM